jgi:polyisoprenoid-binding protein YceI
MRFTASGLLAVLLSCAFASAAEPPAPPPWGPIAMIHTEPFDVDEAHSYLGFTIGFLGMTKVRGAFKKYDAWVVYDDKDPARSSATVIVDVDSIDTGLEFRDKDLKSPRFFDAAKFPKIVFQSERVERAGPDRYVVHGTLEIRGVKRAIDLPMTQTVARQADAGWGNVRVGGSGGLTLKRSDFGISGGDFWGGKVLSDAVEVEVDLLATRGNYEKWGFQSREKPSAGEAVWKIYQEKGADAALASWAELKQSHPTEYNFDASEAGLVGNRLYQRGQSAPALAFLKLGLESGPKQPAGFHCRIGEVELSLGHRDSALAEYRKALELDKDSAQAIEMLRRLEPSRTASSR